MLERGISSFPSSLLNILHWSTQNSAQWVRGPQTLLNKCVCVKEAKSNYWSPLPFLPTSLSSSSPLFSSPIPLSVSRHHPGSIPLYLHCSFPPSVPELPLAARGPLGLEPPCGGGDRLTEGKRDGKERPPKPAQAWRRSPQAQDFWTIRRGLSPNCSMDSLWVSWGAVGGGEDIEKGQSFFKKNINGPRCIAFASVFFFFSWKI